MLRSWRARALLGIIIGILAALAWVRREAHIAETLPLPVIPSGASSDVPVGTNAVEESPIGSSGDLSTPLRSARDDKASGAATRDDEKKELEIRNSSFVILRVPFVSQAPFRVWDLPYKEFCEEASMYALHLWRTGKPTPPADQLDRQLKDIQAWETAHLRTWTDTTAEETVRILKDEFGHTKAHVVRNVTIAMMKAELAKGHPFVVPAAGRELASPYYQHPGPLYHMLVVIGYDDRTHEFITNDAGTNTKGAGFRFSYDNLYGAMHDWAVAEAAPTGDKVMIVIE